VLGKNFFSYLPYCCNTAWPGSGIQHLHRDTGHLISPSRTEAFRSRIAAQAPPMAAEPGLGEEGPFDRECRWLRQGSLQNAVA
jgi:hypothetical protein